MRRLSEIAGPRPSEQETLDWIYERGFALRRRRTMFHIVIASAALFALVGSVLITRQQEPTGLHMIESPPSFATNSPLAEQTPNDPALPTCRNSIDPKCGPVVWEPNPGKNEPLSLYVSLNFVQLQTFQELTVSVVAHDPDSSIEDVSVYYALIESETSGKPDPLPECSIAPHGVWETPTPIAGHEERAFRHSFELHGAYWVWVTARSEGCPPFTPYGDSAIRREFVLVQ